jgi:two-component sensor histidine kinase
MTPPPLDFIAEPALVLGAGGVILTANAAARRLFGRDPRGENLHDLTAAADADALTTFLRHAARSTSPVVGAITLAAHEGTQAVRTHAARLPGAPGAGPMLVLRCLPTDDDHFALLSRRVRELDTQLRQRQQEKAALEEALRRNQTLLDELQHRVKNNIQMMMTLVKMSARGREGPHLAEMVETARLRLQAMASTQEAIYRSKKAGTVRTRAFLSDLIAGISEAAGFADVVDADVEDVDLDNEQAHCLALIVNELLTNAGKYALAKPDSRIRVRFSETPAGFELTVSDDGPGLPAEAGSRYSGLQLVRALARQLNGNLDIGRGEGTSVTLSFGPIRSSAGAEPC